MQSCISISWQLYSLNARIWSFHACINVWMHAFRYYMHAFHFCMHVMCNLHVYISDSHACMCVLHDLHACMHESSAYMCIPLHAWGHVWIFHCMHVAWIQYVCSMHAYFRRARSTAAFENGKDNTVATSFVKLGLIFSPTWFFSLKTTVQYSRKLISPSKLEHSACCCHSLSASCKSATSLSCGNYL